MLGLYLESPTQWEDIYDLFMICFNTQLPFIYLFCKISNIPGFIAPTVVGLLLDDYGNRSQWQVGRLIVFCQWSVSGESWHVFLTLHQAVFWISGLVHIIGSLLFLCKGETDRNPVKTHFQVKVPTRSRPGPSCSSLSLSINPCKIIVFRFLDAFINAYKHFKNLPRWIGGSIGWSHFQISSLSVSLGRYMSTVK